MRIIATITGLLLIVIGAIAVAGGDIYDASPWLFAVAIAALGIGGLVGALTKSSGAPDR